MGRRPNPQRQAAQELLLQGVGPTVVARQLGLPPGTVARWASDLAVPSENRQRRPRQEEPPAKLLPVLEALRERQADRAAGRVALSYDEIAKTTGVPKSSVIAAERRWLNRST